MVVHTRIYFNIVIFCKFCLVEVYYSEFQKKYDFQLNMHVQHSASFKTTGLETETVLPPSKKKTSGTVDKDKIIAAKRSR